MKVWIKEEECAGFNHLYIQYDDTLYVGKNLNDKAFCFSEVLPEEVINAIHEYFALPRPRLDYTFAA
jgi:hypothetical protein